MAVVPYRPYPSVEPNGVDTPYQTANAATPDAFGASIGQAFAKFGDELSANAMKMQERANQAHSTELFVNASKELGELDAQQGQLQGKARFDAYKPYTDKATAIWQKYSDAAGNPDTKRMFDQEFRRRISYGVVDEAKHAATAFKQYTNQSNVDALTMLQQDAAGKAQDDDRFQANVENTNSIIKTMGESNNWSPEHTEVMRRKAAGQLWANRLKSMSISDPFRAKELFDKNGEQIDDGNLRDHVRDSIDQNVIRAGSKIGADEIWKSFNPLPGPRSDIGGDSYTRATFKIESGGNPNAVTGSNRGLGQFGPEEEKRFGINDSNRGSPQAQSHALQMETAQNAPKLRDALGRDPTDAELYITHQQGAAGGPALLANPDKPAWEVIRKYYGSDAIAKRAITGNIPNDSPLKGTPVDQITAGQFTDMWKAKYAHFAGTQVASLDNATPDQPFRVAENISPDQKNDYVSPDRLQQALGKVDDYATKTFPDDPGRQAQMRDQLTSEIQRKYSTDKKVLNEQRNARSAIVMTETIPDENGKGPTSLDQLSMNAQVAYQDMDYLQKRRVQSALTSNAKRDVPLTPEALETYKQTKGLRITNPDAFSELDIGGMEGLPRSMKKELINLQLADTKKLKDNTKVIGALHTVGPMLNDAGIFASRTDTEANDRFNKFAGAFDQKLSEFEQNKKHYPNVEEQKQIAAGLLTDVAGSGYFGTGMGARKGYEIPSTWGKDASGNSVTTQRFTQDFITRMHRVPTSRELYQYYQKFNQGQQ